MLHIVDGADESVLLSVFAAMPRMHAQLAHLLDMAEQPR